MERYVDDAEMRRHEHEEDVVAFGFRRIGNQIWVAVELYPGGVYRRLGMGGGDYGVDLALLRRADRRDLVGSAGRVRSPGGMMPGSAKNRITY